MQRVPWERYAGEDVEAVVAMMVNREHPDSTRITPSKGDGGVDILDAMAGPDGGDVVYQVKRYSAPLSKKQKREVEKSLDRLLGKRRDPRWADRNVTQWRLVLPCDPTPEALNWFDELAATYGIAAVWDGLTTIDVWCASYPEVVDYYLEGGRQRIEDAYRQAMSFATLDVPAAEGLDVHAMAGRVQATLAGPLSQDPHYRYTFRFGTGQPTQVTPGPGLVLSHCTSRETGWFAIDVFARCAVSTQERPITLTARFSATKGSPEAEALQRLAEYGEIPDTPLPFSGELDAPGGLAATLVEAQAHMEPAPASTPDEDAQLRLEILGPGGEVIASCHADRTSSGFGTKGGSFLLREIDGIFDMAGRADLETLAESESGSGEQVVRGMNIRLRWRLERLTGVPVMSVSGAPAFLGRFHEPNQFRLSSRHLPARHGSIQSLSGIEPVRALEEVAAAIDALRTIQEHAQVPVRVPDLDEHRRQFPAWARIARVLKGERVQARYPEGALIIDVEEEPSDSALGNIRILMPLEAAVGSEMVSVGQAVMELESPTVHSRTLLPDGTARLTLTTPDRVLFWTLYDPSDEVADLPDQAGREQGSAGG